MATPVDYYELLQVSQHATLQEIKTAFRRLARQYHPDLHPNQTAAVEKFKEICQAYEILSDPQLRQQYDREISLNSSPSNQVGTGNVNGREFYHRGVERTQERDHLAAVENYSKTIQEHPNFWEAYLNRAQAYYHLFKDNLVLEDCQNVLRLKPNCERAYYYLGLSRQRLGYTQSAIDAYSKGIQIDDRLPQFYHHRGLAYEELQNHAQAINDFRIAIRLFQKNRDFSQINFLQQKVNRLSKKQFKFQEQWIKNIFDNTVGMILKFMLTSWLIIKHPKEGLLLAFMSLSKRQAFIIGLIYGLLAVFLVNYLTILPPSNRLFLSFLIFWLPYLSSGLGRRLTRSYGYLSGDVFLGGFISLLISIVFYINLSQIRLPEIGSLIITLTFLVYISHSLKNGYTQIANIPTKPAIFLMMAMLSLIVYLLILRSNTIS